jgi:hypothetical protein
VANEVRHPQNKGNNPAEGRGNGGQPPVASSGQPNPERNKDNPPPNPTQDRRDPATNQLVISQPNPMGQGLPSVPGATRVSWIDQAEAYLDSKGWKRAGVSHRGQTLWDDPLGGKGKEKMGEERRLPMRRDRPDAQVTIVKQLEVPLRPWIYPTEEALAVQRSRDAADLKSKAQTG